MKIEVIDRLRGFHLQIPLAFFLMWSWLNIFDGITANDPINLMKGILGTIGLLYLMYWSDRLLILFKETMTNINGENNG
ncbi:MAG: hypothetical protein QHH15_00475 [Candidatus Thermoplasmatota archaeon]|nr:hypothetical protein [Candidatus Thermoplasmatota archaeon]MDH7506249.1 hypothetical protein [Candidatus Thermoplasmatota archaeon]